MSTSQIWGFDLKDDFTWDLHVIIDDYIPDQGEVGWYGYSHAKVVYNQDSGNVEWFSIGNGAWRQKVVRYNGDTGAFVSEGDLAYPMSNGDNPVWTPTHGTIMIHYNGEVSNPTIGEAGEGVSLPDVPTGYECVDCQAVYKNGKVYRAVGNNNLFTWMDLSDMTWHDASHSDFDGSIYSQLVSWGDKWITISGTKVQIFELDLIRESISNLIEHTLDINMSTYWSFVFMKGDTLYVWMRGGEPIYGRKFTFSPDGSSYNQEDWNSPSMIDHGLPSNSRYWSTFI